MEKETAEKIYLLQRSAAREISRITDVVRAEMDEKDWPVYFRRCGEVLSEIDDQLRRPILKDFPDIESRLLPDIYGDQ